MPARDSLVARSRPPLLTSVEVRRLVRRTVAEAGRRGAPPVTVVLTDDEEIRRLNRGYRGKDRPTDVLSFPADPDVPGDVTLGDVVVSLDTARRQAEAGGRSVEDEVRLLLVHGVIHLLGYDHETDDGEMDALEAEVRSRIFGGGVAP